MIATPSRNSKLSLLWNIFKIVLAAGLVLFVLSKTDLASLINSSRTLSFSWLFLSGALYVLLTLLKALQYYVLMRSDLSYWQVLNVIIWQNAVSNFFLAGAGIVTYITMARVEHDVKVGRSVSTFLLTKIGDLTAIWLVLGISSYLVWSDIEVIHIPILVLLVGIGAVILAFVLSILFRERFISIIDRMISLMGLSKIAFVENGMLHLRNFAKMERKQLLLTFFMLILYSCVYQFVTCFWTYANLSMFHLRLEMIAVVFVTILLQLVSYFPIYVFGGVGITETTALYFWSFFHVSQNILASALLGIRVVFYLLNLIPLIYLPVYSAFSRLHEQAQNKR